MKSIFILINCILFLLNIFFVIKTKYKNIYLDFEIKNSDNFTFFLSKKLYENIYNSNIMNENKTYEIIINCVDTFNFSISNNLVKYWFKNHTNIKFEFNGENPDFLIYDIFGTEHLNPKYNNSIKIAYYSENYLPDLNQADYAISQAHIMYLDRYFKFPVLIWALNKLKGYNIQKIRKDSIEKKNKKFCAAVISSNKTSEYFRFKFIKELNKYKKIDMGGRALNNIGGRVKNKINFLSSYKFSISMENSKGDGYVSEKIIDSFISGTIPIYYGDYTVDEYINPKSFILVKGEQDINKKIEYIKQIDNDDEIYRSIMNEKIFNENYKNIIEKNLKEKIKFLSNIFIQRKNNAKRKDNTNFYLNCFTC